MFKVECQGQCRLCGEEVTINPHSYAPPVTAHPVLDTAVWLDKDDLPGGEPGYYCMDCLKIVRPSLTAEARRWLEYDGLLFDEEE